MTESEKMKLDRERADIEDVMRSESARRFIWRLLTYCGIYQDPGGTTEEIMKALGRRQTGLYVLGILSDVSEESVFQMMREAKNIKIAEEQKYERSNNPNTNDSNDLKSYGSSVDAFIGSDEDAGYIYRNGGPAI